MDNDEFKIIDEFLRHFDQEEVRGRDLDCVADRPPAEVEARLQRFANGQCSSAERQEICRLLDQHREWVRHLARMVRGESGDTVSHSPAA